MSDLGSPMVVEHWVCAIDWGRDVFTMAFQNGGQAKVYNKVHGTSEYMPMSL